MISVLRVWLLSRLSYWRHPRTFLAKTRRWLARRKCNKQYRKSLLSEEFPLLQTALCSFRLTVAMSVFRVPPQVLRAAIASVQRQTFKEFEFLLLNDASPDPAVVRVLEEVARDDSRIRLLHRSTTGGLSVAANDLLASAQGAFVAFVDHDDVLHPEALASIAQAIERQPEVAWVFTDEDKVNARGDRQDPVFKFGFSHHLLLHWNYVSHFRVLRRDWARHLGGFRLGFEGAQDWDLALRTVAAGGKFLHVPRILYHWRLSAGSMAAGAQAKTGANAKAKAAIREHLEKLLPPCRLRITPLFPGASIFQVRWQLSQTPEASVLVPEGHSPPHWVQGHELVRVPDPGSAQSWQRAVARASNPIIVIPTSDMRCEDWQTLAGLLMLPGTVAAAGRWVKGGKVIASGWIPDASGHWWDPWAGGKMYDPGYLNLAWLPQGRTLFPQRGWVAWRKALLEGFEALPPVPGPWSPSFAVATVPGEQVVTPAVSFRDHTSPFPPVPAAINRADLLWPSSAQRLGLLP